MGNVGSTRYDVFPSGSYSVGDEWHRVNRQEDRGGLQTNCVLCGTYSRTWTVTDHWCLENTSCSPGYSTGCDVNLGGEGTRSCREDGLCNTCYVSNWFTIYDRYKYEFNQWTYLGSYEVSGQFYS